MPHGAIRWRCVLMVGDGGGLDDALKVVGQFASAAGPRLDIGGSEMVAAVVSGCVLPWVMCILVTRLGVLGYMLGVTG